MLAALAALPLEFEERGIWFSNFKQSLGVAGISRATNFKEFRSLPEDQRKLYVRNFGGRVSSLLSVIRGKGVLQLASTAYAGANQTHPAKLQRDRERTS